MSAPELADDSQRGETLRQYRELELLYKTAPVGLALLDRELRHIRINDRLAAFNGRPAAEHIGRTIQEMAPAIAPQLTKYFQRIFETGQPVLDIEIHGYPTPGLAAGTVSLGQYYPVKSADGRVEAISVVVVDITARKRAEVERQQVYERITDAFVALDKNGCCTYLNPKAGQLFGRRPAELIGKHIWTEFPEGVGRKFHLAYEKAMTDQQPVALEEYYPPGDRWLESRIYPSPDGLTIYFHDITERKRAEAELREKQAQLLEALRIARLANWEYDVQGDRFIFNDQYYAILRTTAEKEGGYHMSAGHYVRRFVHPDDTEVVRAELATAQAATDPDFHRELVHRIIYADGEAGYLAVHTRIRKDPCGCTVRTYGVIMDISEHKHAKEQARQLANFPELNPNPVLEFTAEGQLAYHNPAALHMARKVGILKLSDLLPVATREIVAECLASGQPRLRLESTHGRHTLSWSFYPISVQQVVHCYVGDITERKHLEEQLRQAQKMEAIGQLAGGVAHDFNNLLTAIIGHLGLLEANPQVTPEMAESLTEIGAAANRAANLTSQLLTFSRRHVISHAALDLNELVGQLTKMLRRVLGADIAMQLDYAPEPLIFNGDRGMIDQVLLNLAVNASDAMPNGGTLRVVTRCALRVARTADALATGSRPTLFVHLAVSDTGAGIAPEILPRIFEPFFTTKAVGRGTGLGLATVFNIVQQHLGWVEVESELGRGTAFHIFLPKLEIPPDRLPVEIQASPARGQGETILLVEDEPAVQELCMVALRRYGYRVLTAASGQEALGVWTEHKEEILLMLTDIIMPGGLSGLQLARQLLQEKPGLRVIYTSGYSAEIVSKELSLKDDVNYLAKPYELDRLFRLVRAALDGEHGPSPF